MLMLLFQIIQANDVGYYFSLHENLAIEDIQFISALDSEDVILCAKRVLENWSVLSQTTSWNKRSANSPTKEWKIFHRQLWFLSRDVILLKR